MSHTHAHLIYIVALQPRSKVFHLEKKDNHVAQVWFRPASTRSASDLASRRHAWGGNTGTATLQYSPIISLSPIITSQESLISIQNSWYICAKRHFQTCLNLEYIYIYIFILCKMIAASLKKWGPNTFANADKAFNLSLPLLDLYGCVKIRYDLRMASRCVKLTCETILYSDVGLKAWHSWLSDFCWCANCSKDSCNTSWLQMLQDSAEYSVRQSCQLHFSCFSCRIDKGWRIWNPNVHQARSGTFETEQFEKGWAV